MDEPVFSLFESVDLTKDEEPIPRLQSKKEKSHPQRTSLEHVKSYTQNVPVVDGVRIGILDTERRDSHACPVHVLDASFLELGDEVEGGVGRRRSRGIGRLLCLRVKESSF